MSDDGKGIVPVSTLATGDVQVSGLTAGESMTAERLAELRGVFDLHDAAARVVDEHAVSRPTAQGALHEWF